MAERLLRRALERAVAADRALLPPRVLSAGVHAETGAPATEEAVAALARLKLELGDHVSRPLRDEELRRADVVLCMGRSHVLAVEQQLADVAEEDRPVVESFAPDGQEVEDPFGSDLARYLEVARMLERLARQRAQQLLAPRRPDR
jgi:protein-tyrosine-phosphatase